MTQHLVSEHFAPGDLEAIDNALTVLETHLANLLELSVEDRRTLNKMGDKSEAFCRQAVIVLGQNRNQLPPSFDFDELQRDLAELDQLRPRLARLRLLASRGEDTEMALGSDILEAALEGYSYVKVSGKGAGLDALRESAAQRYKGGRRSKKSDTPEPPKP